MRLTGTRAYYRPTPPKMPPGLVELMEGLTKEVLKHNPNNIYSFCAEHVQQLLEKRDGPSRTKLMSVEDKIARAQEKIRKRAENRREEYDKNVLLFKQHDDNVVNTDSNGDIILHVPQFKVKPESRDADSVHDSEDAMSPPKEIIQNVLKAPIHHEHELENSSEVEIAQESDTNITKSDDNANEKDDTQVGSNTIAEIEIGGQSNNENKINSDIISSKVSDSETVNKLENKLVVEGATADVASDIQIATEPSNDKLNVDCNIKDVISEIDNQNATENITKDIENIEEVVDDNDIKKIESNDDNRDSTVTPSIQVEDSERPIAGADDTAPDTTKLDTSGIEENHNTDNNCDHVSDPQSEHNSDDIHLLGCDKDTSEANIDGDQHSINTNDHEIQNTELQEPKLSKTDDGIKESPIETSQASSDLAATDIDKDITTLLTENTANNANKINEANDDPSNSFENMPSPIIGNESAVVDNATLVNEAVQDSTTDAIANINSVSAHSSDTDCDDNDKVETSDNMGETIQNDNHDPVNMDLETAAVTIQKVFRTFLFKSRGSTFEDTGNDDGNFLDEDDNNKEECDFPIASALNIDRRAHGITRMDTVLQTVNEEKSLSLSDDSSTLSSAATIIQAHVRGFLVRNKLNSYKTLSTNSLAASNSKDPSITSLEADNDQNKNKTVLNIHIVPEGENYLSRDESLITSMELSLDSSPPSSINLHPFGYDKSERRKRLKREDAIQSISPPSNNSGKLSEDFDSVKELSISDHDIVAEHLVGDNNHIKEDLDNVNGNDMLNENSTVETETEIAENEGNNNKNKMDNAEILQQKGKSIIKMNSDEMDVVTPFISNEGSTLMHSGEFHDAVLPTRVSRSDTSVVSEFKNVLVYFLLWNHS